MAEAVETVEVVTLFGEGFEVRCETVRGEVLRYPVMFRGIGGWHRAYRLRDRVRVAGVVNPVRWDLVRTIYGSDAYVENGCEFDQLEREWLADRGL